MPTLANINGASLSQNPNAFSGGFQTGVQIGTMYRQNQREEEARTNAINLQAKIAKLTPEALAGNQEAFARLLKADPQAAANVSTILQNNRTAAATEVTTKSNEVGKFAVSVLGAKTPQLQYQMMLEEASKRAGVDDMAGADEAMRMAQMARDNPDQFAAEMNQDVLMASDFKNLMGILETDDEPETYIVDKQLYERQSDGSLKSVAGGGVGTAVTLPSAITKDLDENVRNTMQAAFQAAGGGKDGMQAAQSARVVAEEDRMRGEVSQTLSTRYPNATPQDMMQIQSVIDSSPTVEAGLKAADKVRGDQRSAAKATVMSDRALVLTERILNNAELDDVIGSYEGQEDIMVPRSDVESEAIADIEEVTNILTLPNMAVMSGVLSESDLRLLKTISGGAFNRKRSEASFRSDVENVHRILKTAKIIGSLPPKDREAAKWATDKKNMRTLQAKAIMRKLGIPNG